MPTKATVRNMLDDSKFATVWLEVGQDPEGFKIISTLTEHSGHEVFSLNGHPYQKQAYLAWESACFSGVFYIRKRVVDSSILVSITRIAGRLGREDAAGFAVAASAAFLCEMGATMDMSERDLAGWKIESVDHE